jgi:hypothetical protein
MRDRAVLRVGPSGDHIGESKPVAAAEIVHVCRDENPVRRRIIPVRQTEFHAKPHEARNRFRGNPGDRCRLGHHTHPCSPPFDGAPVTRKAQLHRPSLQLGSHEQLRHRTPTPGGETPAEEWVWSSAFPVWRSAESGDEPIDASSPVITRCCHFRRVHMSRTSRGATSGWGHGPPGTEQDSPASAMISSYGDRPDRTPVFRVLRHCYA